MLRIGIIGCGYIAMANHGPAIRQYCDGFNAEIVGCCDSDLLRAKEFGGAFGCDAIFSDYLEMLKETKPDVVCVLVTYTALPKMVMDIMEKGFPVIMEKPPGVTRGEVQGIIDAADKTGMLNLVAFNRRHCLIIDELKDMVGDKVIHSINCVFKRVNRRDVDFYATAIHGIDTVRFIAGCDYKHINFRYQEMPDVSDGAANVYMDCLMESGATAALSFWQCCGVVAEEYHVACRDNDFALRMPMLNSYGYPGGLTHVSDNKLVATVPGDAPRFGESISEKFGFYAENARFFDAVRGGKTSMPGHDIKSALQSVVVAECIKDRLGEYRCK